MASFTSVTHAVMIPEQWADEYRVALQANIIMAKLVKNVEHDKTTKGDVIHIPDISEIAAQDLAESDVDLTGTAPTEGEFTMTINKKKHATVYIPKHLGANLSKYNLREPYTKQISYALAKVMDSDLIGLHTGLSQKVGTNDDGLGGSNITETLIRKAMKFLDVADVPEDDRVLVIYAGQRSELYGIGNFVRADAVGEANQRITKRFMGDIYGMGVYYTSLLPVVIGGVGGDEPPVNSRVNFLLHKDALAIAIPQNVDIDYTYIPQKKAWFLSGDVLYGVAEFRDVAGAVIYTKE